MVRRGFSLYSFLLFSGYNGVVSWCLSWFQTDTLVCCSFLGASRRAGTACGTLDFVHSFCAKSGNVISGSWGAPDKFPFFGRLGTIVRQLLIEDPSSFQLC